MCVFLFFSHVIVGCCVFVDLYFFKFEPTIQSIQWFSPISAQHVPAVVLFFLKNRLIKVRFLFIR
jgi:hypothetical protein